MQKVRQELKKPSTLKTPKTLVFLHGFLGSVNDWESVIKHLPSHYKCICLDLNLFCSESTLEAVATKIFGHLKSINQFPCHLIGYSLGGRICLALSKLEKFLSITIISSHTGLHSELEKEKRANKDKAWVNVLKKEGLDSFLEKWAQQPLFSKNQHEYFKSKTYDLKIVENILINLSVAKQSIYLIPKNTLFIFGEKDLKYYNLYKSLIPKEKLRKVHNAYHRVHIEDPVQVASLITEHVTL